MIGVQWFSMDSFVLTCFVMRRCMEEKGGKKKTPTQRNGNSQRERSQDLPTFLSASREEEEKKRKHKHSPFPTPRRLKVR